MNKQDSISQAAADRGDGPLAHVRQDASGQWHRHSPIDHLYGVMALAAKFARELN